MSIFMDRLIERSEKYKTRTLNDLDMININ